MRTGVYLNFHSNAAIAVKVDETHVFYLTIQNGLVELIKRRVGVFEREFRVFLPNYPIMQAVRLLYGRTGGFELKRSDEAQQLMVLLIKNENSKNRDAAIEAKRKTAEEVKGQKQSEISKKTVCTSKKSVQRI